ncbi:hypothetical protein ElyMa_001437600 [Elysia marginata]|uniref:Uncharacterized protein n=1 Tax=Elysia marginata TaxID=1093978 RepID=A0AAV4J114_9GAST|nr:hypothetical protein ElyMa_001437600 [Elysia marginata]
MFDFQQQLTMFLNQFCKPNQSRNPGVASTRSPNQTSPETRVWVTDRWSFFFWGFERAHSKCVYHLDTLFLGRIYSCIVNMPAILRDRIKEGAKLKKRQIRMKEEPKRQTG